jgi:hypothetical protein
MDRLKNQHGTVTAFGHSGKHVGEGGFPKKWKQRFGLSLSIRLQEMKEEPILTQPGGHHGELLTSR